MTLPPNPTRVAYVKWLGIPVKEGERLTTENTCQNGQCAGIIAYAQKLEHSDVLVQWLIRCDLHRGGRNPETVATRDNSGNPLLSVISRDEAKSLAF